jgi:hypothetical protein
VLVQPPQTPSRAGEVTLCQFRLVSSRVGPANYLAIESSSQAKRSSLSTPVPAHLNMHAAAGVAACDPMMNLGQGRPNRKSPQEKVAVPAELGGRGARHTVAYGRLAGLQGLSQQRRRTSARGRDLEGRSLCGPD